MYKVSKLTKEIPDKEIMSKLKTTTGFWRVQKWLVIHNAKNFPRSAKDIANHLGISVGLVHKTVSEFNKLGSAAIETKGKGGRRNCHLPIDKEIEFIDGFITQAGKGQIATAGEIQEAYEKLIGQRVNKSTIYRLLHRHNWRKIAPMPHHPLRDEHAQESFKKTLESK